MEALIAARAPTLPHRTQQRDEAEARVASRSDDGRAQFHMLYGYC